MGSLWFLFFLFFRMLCFCFLFFSDVMFLFFYLLFLYTYWNLGVEGMIFKYTYHLHWHYIHNLWFCSYKVLLTWSWIGVRWLVIWERGMMIMLTSYVILCLGNSWLVILHKVFLVTWCGMWSPKLSMLVLGRISVGGKLWADSIVSKGDIVVQG